MIDDFLKQIETLKKIVSKSTAVNINSQRIKDQAIDISKEYFSTQRPSLIEKKVLDETNLDIDNYFQELLRLTQGNNPQKKYISKIKSIEKLVKELSIKETTTIKIARTEFHSNDQLLISTLEAIVPTAALSYKQALTDLNICNHKISFRGTATELREALRETLDHLSPDTAIMKEPGFKLEQNQTKPTMKQKVRYILKMRNLNDTKRIPAEKSVEMVDEIIGQMTRAVYNRASLSTHLITTKQEVVQIKRYIDIVFHEILELS
jgi:hypothetical protein